MHGHVGTFQTSLQYWASSVGLTPCPASWKVHKRSKRTHMHIPQTHYTRTHMLGQIARLWPQGGGQRKLSSLLRACSLLHGCPHVQYPPTCRNNDKCPKYVRKLMGIQACGDFCVLATKVCSLSLGILACQEKSLM